MKTIQHVIDKEVLAIMGIPINEQIYDEVLCLIMECKSKIITSGMGKAGHIAHNFAMTLCSIGIPAVFIHPGEAQHGDLGMIERTDILILFSNSGETDELLKLTHLSKALHAHILIISILGNTISPLERYSDITIPTGHPDEVCPLGLTPTTSTTVMKIICDIIIVLLVEATGFTKEEYNKRHHGGYLGQKSK